MREGKKKDDFPGFSGGKKCTFLHFRGIFPPLSKKGVFSGTFSSIPAQNRGKKSAKKGCFSTLFFQIFVFFFRKSATQLPCPSVYMGRKSELRSTEKKNFFFQKIFNFKKPKTLRKICVTFLTTRNFYPYRPLVAQGGVSFPYVFSVQNPLLKIAPKKKSESFCSTII